MEPGTAATIEAIFITTNGHSYLGKYFEFVKQNLRIVFIVTYILYGVHAKCKRYTVLFLCVILRRKIYY